MSKSWSQAVLFVSMTGALVGCSTTPEQPANLQTKQIETPDPALVVMPKLEAPSRSGNPDTYVVFGKRYRVKESSAGHREIGTASWYGWDFHGRKTSSGPHFNMFELTAAHKSLPLPTYVQVTNLENGRRLVVKVNDRGPFVGERILDLSYAAAAQLDMLDRGTAKVEVVALEPYQFLPKLAAKRALARERIASRAPELLGSSERVASIQFAHDKAIAGRTSGTPPAAALEQQALRIAKAPAKEAPRSAGKPQLAAANPVVRTPKAPAKPLAVVAQNAGKNLPKHQVLAARNQPAIKEPSVQRASATDRGPLYVVGMVNEQKSARQVQDRLSDKMQRSVQVDAGAGKQYEIRVPLRNPAEAKQVAMRLASLGVSRSRVVPAD